MYQSVDLPVLDDGAPSASQSDTATAAWELFLRHGNAAYTLARMLSAEDEEAADAVADVFVGIGRRGLTVSGADDGFTDLIDPDDTSQRRAVLALVCRRLSAPPTDPCLHRVISILGETDTDLAADATT